MTTTREITACCPECTSTFQMEEAMVEHRTMVESGYVLIHGVWTGRCLTCEFERCEAANAEYQALVRAAAQIGRVHVVSPLTNIGIPTGEGFDREGEKRFGFWAVSGDMTDRGFEMFRLVAASIVRNINDDRDVELVVNINGSKTLAIVHGIVE